MPGPDQLLVLVSALTIGILTPGPSVIAATQTAFSRGRVVALRYGAGLAVGASFWAGCALLGLATLVTIVPAVFAALKIAGGLYLLWIAVGLWRNARAPMPEAAEGRLGRSFLGGVAISLSNPKTALFYTALILAVFPAHLGGADRALVYALCLATELFWYTAISWTLSAPAAQRLYARAKRWIDRGAGALLGALGAALITETIRETA